MKTQQKPKKASISYLKKILQSNKQFGSAFFFVIEIRFIKRMYIEQIERYVHENRLDIVYQNYEKQRKKPPFKDNYDDVFSIVRKIKNCICFLEEHLKEQNIYFEYRIKNQVFKKPKKEKIEYPKNLQIFT